MKSRSTNELPSAICSENGPFDVTHRQNFWRSANVREGWLADTLEKRIPRPLRSEENLPLWLSRLLINNSSPRSTINEMDNKWTLSPRAREVTLVAETWLENNPSFPVERKFTHVRYERFDRDRGTTSSALRSSCFRLAAVLGLRDSLDQCQNVQDGEISAHLLLLSPPWIHFSRI